MSRPLVLFVDDLYGNSQSDRFRLCQRLKVQPVNPGDELHVADAIADGRFVSGQRRTLDEVENDVGSAIRQIEEFWDESVRQRLALVLLDLQFDHGAVREGPLHPDKNWPQFGDAVFGLAILQAMIDRWPDPGRAPGHCRLPVVVLSDQERMRRSGQAARSGAADYIEKENLTYQMLGELLDEHGLLEDDTGSLYGQSIALLEVLRAARGVGRNARGNLLILGGRGTGKTSLAGYVHRHSPRAERHIQKFTVQPGSEQLLVAQLFGAWPGAYTDSPGVQVGAAERAHQSTLFLDEIANLPPRGQADLLEYGRLRDDGMRALKRLGNLPSGSSATEARKSVIGEFDAKTQLIYVDVFLIAATNQPIDDPEYRSKAGFLPDLFDRLGREYGAHLTFPPLAERPEDIPMLFAQFLESETKRIGGTWPKVIEPALVDRLLRYDWPGNVADLRGVATEVARNARTWDEALERSLPRGLLLEPGLMPASGAKSPASGKDKAPEPEPRKKSQRTELEGALQKLNETYGREAETLLEAALDLTRDSFGSGRKSEVLGDLSPTKAIKILLRENLTTMQAADVIKRIFELSGKQPAPGSYSERVLRYARQRRAPAVGGGES